MESEPVTFALALGSSGDWYIEVLETKGVGLTLVIENPYMYLQARIPSGDTVRRFHEMLASPLEKPPEVSLGRILGKEVETWISSGRIWFRLMEEDSPHPTNYLDVRFDADRDRAPLRRAVESVLEDLDRRARGG